MLEQAWGRQSGGRRVAIVGALVASVGAIGPWAAMVVNGTTVSVLYGFSGDGRTLAFLSLLSAGLLMFAKGTGDGKWLPIALLGASCALGLWTLSRFEDLAGDPTVGPGFVGAIVLSWGVPVMVLGTAAGAIGAAMSSHGNAIMPPLPPPKDP